MFFRDECISILIKKFYAYNPNIKIFAMITLKYKIVSMEMQSHGMHWNGGV